MSCAETDARVQNPTMNRNQVIDESPQVASPDSSDSSPQADDSVEITTTNRNQTIDGSAEVFTRGFIEPGTQAGHKTGEFSLQV